MQSNMEKMKITLVSNYLTIHQISICEEFMKRDDVDFVFVSSFAPNSEKIKYSNHEHESFVIRAYESEDMYLVAQKRIKESDIVIFGSGDRKLILNSKQTIFFYSEHFSKTKVNLLRKIHIKSIYQKYKNAYLLCASSHSKKDYNSLGLFRNKCFYYGYFPKLVEFKEIPSFSDDIKILWSGRELDWKHPEYAFYAAEYLYYKKINNEITLVSTNENLIKDLFEKYKNEPWIKNIKLIPNMSNEEMQKLMNQSNIFLMTSDIKEGWGAVTNEAMNAGCCVIGSKNAGSVDFLIKDSLNGYVFKDKDEFIKKLELSIKENNFALCGNNARKTIKTCWNAKNAVKNLVETFEIVLNRNVEEVKKNEGPGTLIV